MHALVYCNFLKEFRLSGWGLQGLSPVYQSACTIIPLGSGNRLKLYTEELLLSLLEDGWQLVQEKLKKNLHFTSEKHVDIYIHKATCGSVHPSICLKQMLAQKG